MDGASGEAGAAGRERVVRFQAIVIGRVQGVGFRWFVCDRAADLGLVGWVRNRADGSVEVLAQGDRAALAGLEAALRRGPPGAAVRTLEVSWWAPLDMPPGFHVRGSDHPGD